MMYSRICTPNKIFGTTVWRNQCGRTNQRGRCLYLHVGL